jgi:Flp pilus assembly protein TadB
MTALLLAAACAGWVVATRWHRRPPPRRIRALLDAPPGGARRARVRSSLAAAVGRATLAVVRRVSPPTVGARLAAVDERRLGRALLAVAAVAPAGPVAVPVAGLVAWTLPILAARRARLRRTAEVRRHLPEVVDLLSLAVGAGMNVPLAVAAVARRAPGPVAVELGRVVAEAGAGRRLGDALADLPGRLGEEVRPLVAGLVASERYGTPVADGLDRLAGELRTDRRRRAEEAARRVPVKLLFPLVTCILPAFALLTVAPLLAGALQALRP